MNTLCIYLLNGNINQNLTVCTKLNTPQSLPVLSMAVSTYHVLNTVYWMAGLIGDRKFLREYTMEEDVF